MKKYLSFFFFLQLIVLTSCTTDADDEWNAAEVCPESGRGTFVDERDGQTYKYTTIGNQVWMAQNLNYKGERDTCLYEDNCVESGRLYYSCSAECPPGWHMPSIEEWKILLAKMDSAETRALKLKSREGWLPLNPGENANGTDECDLNIKPWSIDRREDGYRVNYFSSQISSDFLRGVLYIFFSSSIDGFSFTSEECSKVNAYARCVRD